MKKAYMLTCTTLNDNDEVISDPVVLAGTVSTEVAKEIVALFLKRANGRTTMTHEAAIRILLPGLIAENKIESMLDGDAKDTNDDSSEASLSKIFDLMG